MRETWGLMDGTSADEARFFRGGAIQARAGPVSAVIFGSDRRATPLLTPGGDLRGIDGSGYHRTSSEIARKGTLTERSAGGGLRIAFGELLSVGGGFLATALRTAAVAGGDGAVRGVSMRRGSVDLRASVGGFSAFGEALPSGAQTPWIAGALFADPAGRRLLIVRRFYPPADDLHGTTGFADASGGSNEEGTYVGVEAAILPGLVVSAYLDLYSRIRPVQGSVQPPSAVDRLVCVRAAPAKSFSAEVRVRSRRRETGVPDAAAGPLPVPGNRIEEEFRSRGEVRWSSGDRVACGIRLDYCVLSPGTGPGESGVMATAELTVDPWRGMTIDARARFFRSDSYASGIPSVDVDLPGTIASTVYAGEGSAWSAGWGWRWTRHVRLSLRYSILRRDDLRRIGTGPGELPSNIREKAGFQLDLAI
jgi:hypothetical protein